MPRHPDTRAPASTIENRPLNTDKPILRFSPRRRLASLAWICVALSAPALAHSQVTGPGSPQSPYLIPAAQGVITKSLLTAAGDPDHNLPGSPTSLAFSNRTDDSFTLWVGHPAGPASATTTAIPLGQWVIQTKSLQPKAVPLALKIKPGVGSIAAIGSVGSIASVADSLPATAPPGAPPATRPSLLLGESGPDGRSFGVWQTADRQEAIELPAMGKARRASLFFNPDKSTKSTFALWIDPQDTGHLYAFLGDKPDYGTPLQTLGLDKGKLFGVAIDGIENEDRLRAMGEGVSIRKFILVRVGDGSSLSGSALDKRSDDFGVTRFLAPAAGAWDPARPNDFYFVTTDRFDDLKEGADDGQIGRSRLWRLSFHDHAQPMAGGTLSLLLDGIGKYQCFSALAIDAKGRILLGESPGDKSRGAKLWCYSIADKSLVPVAELDAERFSDPKPPFTRRVDTTTILDASAALGEGWWLVGVRAVRDHGPAGGQIIAVFVP